MNDRRLKASDSVLIVVDMQQRLIPAIADHEQVIGATRLMMRSADALDVPTLLTTQYAKGLGATHPQIAELARSTTAPTDKLTFSCFGSADFNRRLSSLERRTLILCGVEAHICVLQTGLDALESGFTVHVIADATGSRSTKNRDLGHERLRQAGAVLSSSEMAIYEMLGASDAPAFKTLLPFFK
jgi:nicotinamidase-related amidase